MMLIILTFTSYRIIVSSIILNLHIAALPCVNKGQLLKKIPSFRYSFIFINFKNSIVCGIKST